MTTSIESARVTDRPTLDLVERIQALEGEPTTAAIIRRAIRQYAIRNHPDLIPSVQVPAASTTATLPQA